MSFQNDEMKETRRFASEVELRQEFFQSLDPQALVDILQIQNWAKCPVLLGQDKIDGIVPHSLLIRQHGHQSLQLQQPLEGGSDGLMLRCGTARRIYEGAPKGPGQLQSVSPIDDVQHPVV